MFVTPKCLMHGCTRMDRLEIVDVETKREQKDKKRTI
jgi:hypothetical protein